MKIFTNLTVFFAAVCLLLFSALGVQAQRNYATTNRVGASGLLCVNCIVTNRANASDGNPQTFSVLNVAVGIAASTYEELIFPAAGKVPANTPVSIKLGSGDNLLDVTALGGIFIQAYNGNTPVAPGVGAATLVTAASNNNQVLVTFTPTQTYDRIRITLNGGLIGALSSIYLYEAFYNTPGVVPCNTAIDELHGISAGLLNLGVDVGGVANPTNAIDGDINTYSTLNASVGAVGATVQQTALFQSLSTPGDSVRLTLSIPQALIDAGVLTRLAVNTYNGNSNNGDSRTLNSALLNVRLLDLVNQRRRVTVTYAPSNVFDRVQLTLGGGIANVLSSVNLHEVQRVLPRPVIKNNNAVVANLQICGNSAVTLTATAMPNTVFNWYTSETGGTPIFTGATFTTPVLTTTTTYYVAASRAGCTDESERTRVIITVNAIPANPTLTSANTTICAGDVAVLSVAAPVAGVTYRWYDAQTGGTLVHTGNSFTTAALNTGRSYFVEAINAGGCSSAARAEAVITVQPRPAAPTLTANNQTINAGQTATISATSATAGATFNWYTTANATTPFFTGNSYTTPALFASQTYYVSAVNANGCQSSTRASITITVNIDTNTPCTFANQQTVNINGACIACTVTNTALVADADTTTASTISVGVGLAGAYAEQILKYQQPGFAGDMIKLVLQSPVGLTDVALLGQIRVTIYNGSTVVRTVTLNDNLVTLRLLGGGNRYAVFIPAPAGYDGVGVRLSSGVATLLTSVQLFYSSQQYPAITFADASPEICTGGTAQLSITSPASATGTFNWYAGPNGGAPLYSGSTITTNPINANTTLYVEYSRNGCVSPTRVPITIVVNPVPLKPVVQPSSATIYSGQTVTFKATAVGNTTINWYTTPTNGIPVFTGTTFTTPALSANAVYYAEASNGTCTSVDRTQVNVTVLTLVIPDVAVTPPTQNIITGQTATMTASSTTPGTTFNWYTTPTNGTPIFTGPTFTTPALSANATYYAEAVVTASGAVSATRASGQVIVNAATIPNVAVTPPTQAVNPSQTATFTASSTTPGTSFNWYTTPTNGSPIFTGAVFTTPPVFSNSTYYAEAIVDATGIKSASRASGTVTLNIITPNVTVTPPTQNINSGQTATLTASSTTPGASFNWYTTPTNGTPIFTGPVFTSPALYANATYYAEAVVDATGVTSTNRASGVVTVTEVPPGTPVIATTGTNICSGTATTLTVSNPNPDLTVRWYAEAGLTTLLATGNTFTTTTINNNTTYYAQATDPGGNKSAVASVTVTVIPRPAAPVVTVASTTTSSITFQWAAVSGATGYEVSTNNGAAFSSAGAGTTYTITGLQPNQSAGIIVRATGTCQTGANSVGVTGTSSNPLGNGLFVPNAFTPNGDGNNDIVYVYGTAVKGINFWVYNQWGELLYRTNVLNTGWDGTYKGRIQPVGVYVYYVEATMNDGQLIKQKGTITLLR
ncbi:gliding motility-associated C-terminal domain-containing protein [Mucilaginibacter auburnensis]|uniref:Gliding motility-associated-like protein n=1 Tax=Mucilaginibacter auburnensis TaxID=1457233 RepID=A0A2H9VLN2_9SPHI|nr:gliding motility-associated C-terminal domain-containing protein [Mucilaginibacter auburnensis]PJJ79205.1 gliding motility-associated-like protein [Mucilaginibacter auburnensis]